MKYFAYGSNLCTKRLKGRVESAAFVGIGVLKNYQLRFEKRSTDGSAKCNASFTGNVRDEVVGVVFDIDPAEKKSLDSAEGLGRGYDEKTVVIEASDKHYDCYTYFASSPYIERGLPPYSWYRDIVLVGAREHGLPEDYIQAYIISVEAITDPDHEREARERSCLGT